MSKKVLLIEDDQTVRENTAEILELSDYDVETAADGEIGIQSAIRFQPDIIVCDIMMPKLDGYDVLKALSQHPKTKRLPFIFLSAKTDRNDVRRGMNLGADDYLTKPFEEDDLIHAIESRIAKTKILQEREIEEVEDSNQLQSFEALKEIIKDFEIQVYDQNEMIYEAGQTANRVFLIERGVVKTHQIDQNGKELTTALFRDDNFFGQLSFTKTSNYVDNATAMEKTKLYEISIDDFRKFFNKNPQVMFEFIDNLGDSLNETKSQLVEMAYSSVRKKTAQTVLVFAERLKKNKLNQIRISRADLAAVAGIASESLIRTLSDFKKRGIIQVEGRNIKILDFEALKNIS
ncbi:response regulator [Psychroflexus halocasei]|uniref:cAMP-binding domain of CRP or a regulatory subunit of cAMP-dependent protein kinases n=1 Tax=Psychroflexus halocasei TaxID=908615 RepID=A0A1H4AJU5_9FLAO|nr:response regulator [Psychroflexus halocasei]SEA35924.1 cAMP-binding domain of CRP or a regulatory subunit of cAMP-dependent protein kinases [Psychroflexus halocasei]